jgi:hypothetical protein
MAALALALLPVVSAAQERERCRFDPVSRETNLTRVQQPSGQFNTYMGRGVIVRCPARDLTLKADSLESFGDDGRVYLLGHVRYVEPRLELTSDYLTYHQQFEHMVATSNVVMRLPSGSTLRGPIVNYYRVMPGVRETTRVLATQRPTIEIVQKDSAGKPSDTLVVVANMVNMIGDSLVHASGTVTMERPEVEARGDSLFMDSERELMVLMRDPSIRGLNAQSFTLTGIRIEMTASNRKLRRVLAMGQGRAVTEDMTLTSDTIDLRVENDLLQRTIAWGPGRARANSAAQQIVADSIDVRMPGQRVSELYAVRGAIAESRPDTLRYKADTLDWLRGDTIIARFDSIAAKDTTKSATRIRELFANGTARSWYHGAPSDTSIRKAAINYVTGRQITVAFKLGKASRVTVVDKATGLYAEPKPVAKAKPASPAQPPTTSPPSTPPVRPPQSR